MSILQSITAVFKTRPVALELDHATRNNSPRTPMEISSPISPNSNTESGYGSSERSDSAQSSHSPNVNKKLPLLPLSNDEPFRDPNEKRWRKIFRLGIPLDIWARVSVIIGFCTSLMAAWGAMQILLAGKAREGKIWVVMSSLLLTWSVCFFVAGYCGFSILWGRWRNSLTATHFLRLTASLLTVLYSIASSLWFFFAFRSATSQREECIATEIFWDGQTVPAPQPWIDLCLRQAESYGQLQVGWGFVNGIQVYLMMVLVLWAAQQERRLRRERRWSRASGGGYSDKASWETVSDVESATTVGGTTGNFERTVAEKVEEFARQEKLERQVPKAVDMGMKIPQFPMPRRGLAVGVGYGNRLRAPSPIPEVIEEVLKGKDRSLPRLSGASALSGAIPIALDLKNGPILYGRAF